MLIYMASKLKKTNKTARKTRASKSSPKAIGKGRRGVRYTTAQKQQVVDFVHDYNSKHGRGGQSHAAKKFELSVLTVASWLRSPALSVSPKAGKAGSVSGGINPKIASLIQVSDQLRKAEVEVTRLRAKYDELRSSIQSLL